MLTMEERSDLRGRIDTAVRAARPYRPYRHRSGGGSTPDPLTDADGRTLSIHCKLCPWVRGPIADVVLSADAFFRHLERMHR